ncbi:hypothetical protein DITRI_Ditri07aG0111700 [Diplodiscus trichospermus]
MTQIKLMVFAVVFTLVAFYVMATSSQSIIFGFSIKADYRYSYAMRFLFVSDAIVIMVLAISGCAVTTTVGDKELSGQILQSNDDINGVILLGFLFLLALIVISTNEALYHADK